jgi:uncharacterized protein YkwD
MADHNFYNHVSATDGSNPFDRMHRAGCQYSAEGENIDASTPTAEAAMVAWMNSPEHRTNILNPVFREIGVGYAFNPNSALKYYWTQDFGG